MSTANTITDMDVKPEVATYGVFTEIVKGKDEQGNETSKTVVRATTNEKAIKAAKEANTLLYEQSVSYDKLGTLAGIQKLGIDDDELVVIFNRGLASKATQKALALLTEVKETGEVVFAPVEGNYDLREEIAEPTQRRNLSPTEKAMKTLKNIDPALLKMLIAQMSSPETVTEAVQ